MTNPEPNPYQQKILRALPRTGKHVYDGTANKKAVAKRRAKKKGK